MPWLPAYAATRRARRPGPRPPTCRSRSPAADGIDFVTRCARSYGRADVAHHAAAGRGSPSCSASPPGSSRPVRPPPRPHGTPGAPGIGDKLYPMLGNGGYDALHYDVDLRYATSDPAQPLDGTVTILARATQSLSRFDLDFGGAGRRRVSASTAGRRAWRRVRRRARDHAAQRDPATGGRSSSRCATSPPRRPRPTRTCCSRPRSSSRRTGAPPPVSRTPRTRSCPPTTTRATRRQLHRALRRPGRHHRGRQRRPGRALDARGPHATPSISSASRWRPS